MCFSFLLSYQYYCVILFCVPQSRSPPPPLVLPELKKQRTDVLNAYDSGTSGSDEEQEGTTDKGKQQQEEEQEEELTSVASGPSPSSPFAASSVSFPRLHTYPPSSDGVVPRYLTRVRHAAQLVVITTNPKHNQKPYKVGKDMDVVRQMNTEKEREKQHTYRIVRDGINIIHLLLHVNVGVASC